MKSKEELRSRSYDEKKMGLKEALELIRTGDHIFVGSACGEPQYLVNGLVEKASHLEDNEILHVHTLGVAPYTRPIYSERFRLNAFFVGINTREAVAQGRADYTPVFLSDLPRLIRRGMIPIDVALIQVTPPDEHGFCSLGVSVEITKTAAENAKLVIAQVNREMPRVLGDSFIHVNQIDVVVEHDEPILEMPRRERDIVSERIARYVSQLVDDESTLQIGIGSIPDSVLDALVDKRDLGIHTELLTEGVVDLVEDGVVTCAKKTINRGKIIASFAMGTRRLYDFIDNNPMVEFYESDYVNNPLVISQHEKMVAINQALEIDLTGQVCSDSLGYRFYSGLGGQADFIRGAMLAKNGKAITVIPSTAKEGKISRIKPHLSSGAGVVLTRGDVDYVVTEYGIANLRGKSIKERALSIINIAHPRFRNSLLEWAKRRHYVPQEVLPFPELEYPEELERRVTLKDGTDVLIRPIKPSDATMKQHLFYSLSKEAVVKRYFGSLRAFPLKRVWPYVIVDYNNEMVLVASISERSGESIIGIGSYSRIPNSDLAEVAFVVRDDWQNKGLGSILFKHLAEVAIKKGISGFVAWVMRDNIKMMRVFRKSSFPMQYRVEGDLYHVKIDLSKGVTNESNHK
ncbi:MAG: GNAT family N-acetyltransferase [Candidatus Bathyarchaeota archaeon]|nr:GNAT family N-acetyltransferase [Candidatus Bathyarchaeota archaeon]